MALKDYNILFLGGAKRVSMARLFQSAGQRIGLNVNIFGYELDTRVPLAAVGKIIVGRKWRDTDLYQHLHGTIEDYSIDLLVPFVDPAVGVCARYVQKYGDVKSATGSVELSDGMFDKAVADRLFRDNQIPVPAKFDVGNPSFPIIAKPRTGSASKGIYVIRNREELMHLSLPENQYLMQEFIDGAEEFTVDCYVSDKGDAQAVVPRKRIDVIGGEVNVTETVSDSKLISLSNQILKSLGLRGPVTLQFLHDPADGRYLLMEINPRLGGGCVCSVYAGADIPGLILSNALGKNMSVQNVWRPGVRMTRYMQQVVFDPDGRYIQEPLHD